MLLAIDVGNTQTVIGLYAQAELRDHWRISTSSDRTSDELAVLFRQFIGDASIDGVAISSVVPRATFALKAMAQKYFDCAPVVIEAGTRTGMPILTDNPKEVGADRIVNAIGAYDIYGGPTIVVDFGTATTLDAVSGNGEYLGGVILPGIEISLDALFARADKLVRVELVEPRNVIGKNTVESLQSGAIYGFAAQIDGLCARMRAELGECSVVATGGLSGLIARFTTSIEHLDPWLTLQGLRIVYERNTRDVNG